MKMSVQSMSLPAFLVFYLGTICIISVYIYSQRLPSYDYFIVTHNKNAIQYDTNVTDYQCAGWLPQENRKILFVNFKPFDSLPWWSEEYHVTLNLAKSLMLQGFEIHTVNRDVLSDKRFWRDNSNRFHRIFHMAERPAIEMDWIKRFDRRHGNIHCKFRVLVPNEELWDDESLNFISTILHEKQILLPNPRDFGTSVGYYPIFPKEQISSLTRHSASGGRDGEVALMIFTDNNHMMEYMKRVGRKLNEIGIKLHVVFVDNIEPVEFVPRVVVHHNVSRDEMLSLIVKSVFLVRCGDQEVSSPLSAIALHLGTAILDVCAESNDTGPQNSELGMPYLYSVKIDNFDELEYATALASKNRFHSHALVKSGTFDDRTCAMMEDDSVCSCPNDADCRSKFYLQKGKVFEALNEHQ